MYVKPLAKRLASVISEIQFERRLARDNHQGLLFAYKGSMDGDAFDTEFFLENALEILEEEAAES